MTLFGRFFKKEAAFGGLYIMFVGGFFSKVSSSVFIT